MTKRTVKVRVAVAVDVTGKWCASGWPNEQGHDEPLMWDGDLGDLREGERRYWLTAELELPDNAEPEEVAADVEEA